VLGLLIELRYCFNDRKACTHGSFRIVVMGLGIAEEGHHAVTEILGDMAAISGYSFGDGG
jgi:hypothetical protein